MKAGLGSLRRMLWVMAVACALIAGPRLAAQPPAGTCFAVTSSVAAPDRSDLQCAGAPTGYRGSVLWLRLPVPASQSRDASLAMHTTRFERMSVMFEYADTLGPRQTIGRGDFADSWHIGGQVAFRARGDRPASAVWLRIAGLEDYNLLSLRIVSAQAAQRQFELTAFAIGAALALLGIAALFNIGLAASMRRSFFLWHGGWAATVMVWGLVWSQAGLAVFPAAAGTVSARLATVLACLAIMFATFATASALRDALPRWPLRLLGALGVLVLAAGVASGLPGVDIGQFAPVLMIGTLSSLALATACIAAGWRKGHGAARDLAISWAIPMVTLAMTQIVDLDAILWGGGDKVLMLYASALQVVCLTGFATVRLRALRMQRDRAVEIGKALAELAERDPLTGLLNRRGFLGKYAEAFGGAAGRPVGLLLIDVDKFKAVNDEFGHQAGDEVLVTLGRRLASFEERFGCRAGRLGGEEFVLGVSGVADGGLVELAETVRSELAECDFGATAPGHRISVSIGVAQGAADRPFQALYRKADEALYAAKREGRNRVVCADRDIDSDHAPVLQQVS